MASLPTPAEWQRLSPWLDELLDLPAPQRAERLTQLMTEDAWLAGALQSLLDASTPTVRHLPDPPQHPEQARRPMGCGRSGCPPCAGLARP
jgi:hypothetical protein